MKVKDKFLKARKKYSDSKKWTIFLILTIFLLNIGYAASKASLEINGSASAVKIPDLFIEEVKIIDIIMIILAILFCACAIIFLFTSNRNVLICSGIFEYTLLVLLQEKYKGEL